MKPENKIFIKTFLITWLVYAGLMAGYNYSVGKAFSPFRFIFYFLTFGLIMGLINRYYHKKQIKREENLTETEKTNSDNN